MSKGGLWCTWGRSYIVSPSTSGSLRAVRCAKPLHQRVRHTIADRVQACGRACRAAWLMDQPPPGALIVRHSTKSRGRPHRTAPGSTPFVPRSSIGHPSARGPRDPDGASPAWGTPRRSPFAELPASVASGSASSGLGGHSARRRCGHRDSRVTWSWDGPVSRINEIMERESAPVGFGVDCNDKWS